MIQGKSPSLKCQENQVGSNWHISETRKSNKIKTQDSRRFLFDPCKIYTISIYTMTNIIIVGQGDY